MLVFLVESLGDHAVADQAWSKRALQREPVLRLANVENVAAVGGAGCDFLSQYMDGGKRREREGSRGMYLAFLAFAPFLPL